MSRHHLSLYEAFESVPDARSPMGLRHPPPSLLTLATVAIFSGATGPSAIAQFGRERGVKFAARPSRHRSKTNVQPSPF